VHECDVSSTVAAGQPVDTEPNTSNTSTISELTKLPNQLIFPKTFIQCTICCEVFSEPCLFAEHYMKSHHTMGKLPNHTDKNLHDTMGEVPNHISTKVTNVEHVYAETVIHDGGKNGGEKPLREDNLGNEDDMENHTGEKPFPSTAASVSPGMECALPNCFTTKPTNVEHVYSETVIHDDCKNTGEKPLNTTEENPGNDTEETPFYESSVPECDVSSTVAVGQPMDSEPNTSITSTISELPKLPNQLIQCKICCEVFSLPCVFEHIKSHHTKSKLHNHTGKNAVHISTKITNVEHAYHEDNPGNEDDMENHTGEKPFPSTAASVSPGTECALSNCFTTKPTNVEHVYSETFIHDDCKITGEKPLNKTEENPGYHTEEKPLNNRFLSRKGRKGFIRKGRYDQFMNEMNNDNTKLPQKGPKLQKGKSHKKLKDLTVRAPSRKSSRVRAPSRKSSRVRAPSRKSSRVRKGKYDEFMFGIKNDNTELLKFCTDFDEIPTKGSKITKKYNYLPEMW